MKNQNNISMKNLKNSIMKNQNNTSPNKIDSSLCSNCIHVNSCVLTESKRFIWSCSEFESESKDLHKKHITKILKPQYEF